MTKSRGRGRPPQGERALSGAERQARYRQRHAEGRASPSRPRGPLRQRPRPQRWHAAVAELIALQAEYAFWLDVLPEPLHDTATVGLQPAGLTRGEALQAIVDLDLDELVAIEPPRGFGRD